MNNGMENRDWLNEYVSLKQVKNTNPFTVPTGYFNSLEDHTIALKNSTELYNNIEFTDGFEVPENYFESLTSNINSRIIIEDTLNKGPGFTIPGNYFESLTKQIQGLIFLEEVLGEPSDNFTVPDGYFNKLSKSILKNTINADVVKNRGIVRQMYTSNVFKYATAACFALALSGGILLSELTSSVNDHRHTFLHKQLSNVSIDDIQSYLQINSDPTDTQQSVASENSSLNNENLENALQNDSNTMR